MGAFNSNPEPSPITYSVPVGPLSESSTQEYINPSFPNYISTPFHGLLSLQDLYNKSFHEFSSRPLLGTRHGNEYVWTNYGEVYSKSLDFASGLLNLNLCPVIEDNGIKIQFISILAKNCEKWHVTDFGCITYGIVVVPLYDTLGPNATEFILRQTGLQTIVLSNDMVERIVDLKRNNKAAGLQNVVCFEDVDRVGREKAAEVGLNLYTFDEVLSSGRNSRAEIPKLSSDSWFTLSYTSGTTGEPKGVIINHKMMLAEITGVSKVMPINFDDVHISYLPLAHVFDRIMSHLIVLHGGRIGYFSGDILKLRDDLMVLKPTIYACVPRILARYYDSIKSHLNSFSGQKSEFIKKALALKLENLKKSAEVKHALLDSIIFNNYSKQIGGRVKYCIVSSAPICSDVLDFLKVAFCCQIYEGYGQTEIGGAATFTYYNESQSGHVGGPMSFVSLKLVDVPEMNYLSRSIDENGNPNPCGEVCLKGPSVTPGYYKNPTLTSEIIDSEGWLHTGDIGSILPNGSLKIIDRKKNLFKLSQGEYLAPEKLENVYLTSKYSAFVFVHGDSLRNWPVAVVVPDKITLSKWAEEKGINKEWAELCKDQIAINEVLQDLRHQGQLAKLNGFELVKRIYLYPEAITLETGLLTPTFKIKRFQMKNFFLKEIDEMYKEEDLFN